jgi:flagellar basal body-associated protein FliL
MYKRIIIIIILIIIIITITIVVVVIIIIITTTTTTVEHEIYDRTRGKWNHRNSNKRFKEKFRSHPENIQ